MRQWPSWLLLVLMVSHLVLAFLSWLGNAAGYPVHSILSAEGLRWIFLHAQESFHSPVLACLILVLMATGAVSRSGLGSILMLIFRRRKHLITYRQWVALLFAGFSVLVLLVCAVLLITFPRAVLLSATGHLFPSPFMKGVFPAAVIGIQFVALQYGMLSNHLRGINECMSVLYWGLQKNALWIVVVLLLGQLKSLILFCVH